jgi:hypothetical protein
MGDRMETTTSALPEGEKLYGKLPPDLGEWLFKDRDQVLGPVPPDMLLTKLYDGFLTADTPVAQEIGQWKPLREIWFLGAHVNRAQQRAAYVQALDERTSAEKRHGRTRLLMGMLFFSVLFVSALGGARWTMITRPWEDKTDWLTRKPDLVKLPDRAPKLAVVTRNETPSATAGGEEKRAPPEEKHPAADATKGKDNPKGAAKVAAKDEKKRDDKKKDEKPVGKDAKQETAEVKTEPPKQAGVPTELTKEQMLAVFKGNVPGYKECIASEAKRNADMPGTITVEFVINNEGATKDFKVQEREIRDGPLAACLAGKIASLRFPKFSGEVKTFIFPFKITRK